MRSIPFGRLIVVYGMAEEDSTEALEYKVLVLGSSQVGKTSLIRKYTTGNFPTGLLSTIGRLPPLKIYPVHRNTLDIYSNTYD